MRELPVSFYLPGEDITSVAGLSPDRDWRDFGYGVRAWILQTYLRMLAAGHPVTLTGRMPLRGVVVAHADSAVYTNPPSTEVVLVVVRADKAAQTYADFEIVQNGPAADAERVFHVHHWPQPGLVPRSSTRGDHIRVVEFKGHVVSLNPALRGRAFAEALAQRGIEWRVDVVDYRGHVSADYSECRWNDYSSTDLSVAVRHGWRRDHPSKPASKLINSWLAGSPAILGPESAYRELRRSELDYVEVTSLDEMIRAIDHLRGSPERYRAMIEGGFKRAQEFTTARLVDRWARLLFEEVPQAAARRPASKVGLRRRSGMLAFALRRAMRGSGYYVMAKRAADILRER